MMYIIKKIVAAIMLVISSLRTTQLNQNCVTYGNEGRLYINDANYSAALYSSEDANTWVKICDDEDSACYIRYSNLNYPWELVFDDTIVIADHNYQGVNNCKKLSIGSIAYIEQENGEKQTYILSDIDRNGSYIEQETIIDGVYYNLEYPRRSSGEMVNYGNKNGFTMYTCNEDRQHITIFTFEKIE